MMNFNKMIHFTRVQTIPEWNFVVGNNWTSDTTISDITLDYENIPLEVLIWAAIGTTEKRLVATIPYHAVQMLVK